MNKAEERAKERYWLEPCNIDTQNRYQAYLEGYQQAEKDLDAEQVAEIAKEETIKEVCEWLYNHNDYICGSTNGIIMYDMDKLIDDLKKHFIENIKKKDYEINNKRRDGG